MAVEFKKLSEVEKIEELSDTASVLVEDGGEVKRVLKDAVGGGSGGGYDVIITYAHEEGSGSYDLPTTEDNNLNLFTVPDGAAQLIVDKLKSGQIPSVKIMALPISEWEGADSYCGRIITPVDINFSEDLNSIYIHMIIDHKGWESHARITLRIDSNVISGCIYSNLATK